MSSTARAKYEPEVKPVQENRVGVFGGMFNPPHYGHLAGAQEAAHQLNLDRVLFIPAAEPPHRKKPGVSAENRYEMTALAVESNPVFKPSRIELKRAEISYTVDTLAALRSRSPDSDFYLIVGADELNSFTAWKRWNKILELSELVAMNRPGFDFDSVDSAVSENCRFVEIPALSVSSRIIRQRCREGRPIRYLVPAAVRNFIIEKNLYSG